jgi:hypothetical protein
MEQKHRVLLASGAAVLMLGAGAGAVAYGMHVQPLQTVAAVSEPVAPQNNVAVATSLPSHEQSITAQLNREQALIHRRLGATERAPLRAATNAYGGEPGAPINGNTTPVARVFDRIGNEIDAAFDARTPVKDQELHKTIALNAIDDPQDVLAQVQIKNRQGEALGSVNSLNMAKSGRIDAVRADVGGFLGLGEHVVSIPVNRVVYLPDRKLLVTDMTRDDLKALYVEKPPKRANNGNI